MAAVENRKKLVIMNFSGVYEKEDFYKDMQHLWIDCRDILGTNCYCDEEAEKRIGERIRDKQLKEGIHFLDSGNYHYLSKIWLDQVEEDMELLVFDHHTDMQLPMFGDILSCGGWIKTVLEHNPRVTRVWLAGPPAQAVREIAGESWAASGQRSGPLPGPLPVPLPGPASGMAEVRVVWISEDDMTDLGFWKKQMGSSSLPLYISVDKDVLSRDHARTNWNQGSTKRSVLLDCISAAASCRRIIGMDVCGEDPEGDRESAKAREDISINNQTNRELICCFMEKCGIVS